MSSPDFNSILTQLQSSITKMGEAYVADYTQAYKDAVALATTLIKYVSADESIDEIESTDWTDVVDQASQIVDAANNSPVMQEIYKQIEEEFGLSVRTPMALAQNIMQGKDSSLLKVVVAMLAFEGKMRSLYTAASTVHYTMDGINNFLASRPTLTGILDPEYPIPNDLVVRLETARNELQKTLNTPFNVKKYETNMDEIRLIAEDMEDIPIFKGVIDAAGNMALKMMLDTTFTAVNSAYRLIQRSGDDCKKNMDIILTTDTTLKGPNSKRFVMAKKAVRRINDVLGQMKRGDVQQGLQLPKYIVALNVAYAILKTGQPINDPASPSAVVDISGITVTETEIDAILTSCRKLLRATQIPRKLVSIQPEITNLYSLLQTFDAHINESVAAIEANNTPSTFGAAFEIAESALLLLEGLDMASMFLENGDYEEFFNATESNATSEASAIQSLSLLADMCDKVGLTAAAGVMRKKSKDMEKNEREKRAKREIKKDKRKSKLATDIEKINKMISDSEETVATAIGLIQGITSLSN